MEISVVGINYRTAPVHVREKVSLPGDLARRLLDTIRTEKIFAEALVLDTCNRTEVYFVANEQCRDPVAYLVAHIALLKQTSLTTDTSVFYRHDGQSAVTHLFRVAASLDSQIVGEHEILDQLKSAYRMALEAGTAKFMMNKLMHWALRVGKRVQTETELGRGTASVPQAAVELSRQLFSSLEGKTVLLVGAGQTAESAAVALLRCGAGHLVVANRTLSRAEELAGSLLERGRSKVKVLSAAGGSAAGKAAQDVAACPKLAGADPACSIESESSSPQMNRVTTRAVGLDEIPDVINGVDLLISSTGSPGFVLTYDALSECLRRGEKDHPLLIVDIAVPRDADPRLGDLTNVFLYNIDDLDRLVAQNIGRRRMEIPRAEAIVHYEAQQFAKWRDSLRVVPTIKLLQKHIRSAQEEAVKRYGRKFSSSDRGELEQFAQGLCNKLFHDPIAFLRALSSNGTDGEALAALALIRSLFDLDSQAGDSDD